jgi:hypothetical protein
MDGFGPGLLVCPPTSLHVTAASLLSVRREYERPKEDIWDEHKQEWATALKAAIGRLSPFEIRFRELRVTETAVIALADPVDEVATLRAMVANLQSEAGFVATQPTILHCTLLRYGADHIDLDRLAAAAEATGISTTMAVTSLLLSKELVYPNLVSEPLQRYRLGAG